MVELVYGTGRAFTAVWLPFSEGVGPAMALLVLATALRALVWPYHRMQATREAVEPRPPATALDVFWAVMAASVGLTTQIGVLGAALDPSGEAASMSVLGVGAQSSAAALAVDGTALPMVLACCWTAFESCVIYLQRRSTGGSPSQLALVLAAAGLRAPLLIAFPVTWSLYSAAWRGSGLAARWLAAREVAHRIKTAVPPPPRG